MAGVVWIPWQRATAGAGRPRPGDASISGADLPPAGYGDATENPRNFRLSLLPRPGAACMRRQRRMAGRQRSRFVGFGGSVVVQGSGHTIPISGAALALDRSPGWRAPAVPLRPAAPAVGAHALRGMLQRKSGRRDVYHFSRFFPSIPGYRLYKIRPGASVRPNSGDVISRSSQPRCGYLLSLEADA
jgi:hypothetical protein